MTRLWRSAFLLMLFCFVRPLLAAEQIYTLEFLRTDDRNKAVEQALVISGVVRLPCRITTSAGIFYLRCGASDTLEPVNAEQQRIAALGINKVKLTQIADDRDKAIYQYQPIDVGLEAQKNLIKMVRSQMDFNVTKSVDAQARPDLLAPLKQQRQTQQGDELITQGWLAYENHDLTNAIELFGAAAKIDSTRLSGLFGLGLSYFNNQQYHEALSPFRTLLEQEHEAQAVLPLYLQAALNTDNFDIVQGYYTQLPTDQQKYWRDKLSERAMKSEFAALGGHIGLATLLAFIERNQQSLKSCEPVDIWLKAGKRLITLNATKQAKALYHTLWQGCQNDGVKIGILYQLNKLAPYAEQAPLVEQALARSKDKNYRRQLKDYRYNSLMAQAGALPPGSAQAGALYRQIKSPYTAYTRYKLAVAWWLYQQQRYAEAMADFSWLWHKRQNKKALQGMLFAMMRLGELDEALDIATRFQMPDMKVMVLKEKLAALAIPSPASEALAYDIIAYDPQYTPALSSLGWNAIAKEQWALARTYFTQWRTFEPDNQASLSGLMQSYSKQQKFDDAFSIARQLDGEDDYHWQYNIRFEQGLSLFNQKQYQKAESIFAELLPLKPKERGLRTLYAWSLYHQGKYKKSAKGFLQLYEDKDEASVAQGYIAALDKLGKDKKKYKFVHALSQSDKAENKAVAADQYSGQKNYLRAAFTDPSPDKVYSGVNHSDYWVDYNYFHKNGTHGVSSLDVKQIQLGGAFVWSPASRLYVMFNIQKLDANTRDDEPFLGNDFTYGDIPPEFPGADLNQLSTKQTLWYPYVRYLREDRWDLDMGIGLSPLSGPLQSKLVWHFTAERGSNELSLYRKPLVTSQLNYTGLKDPYSSKKWGRVLETGVKFKRSGRLTDVFWMSGSGEYNRYAGTDVLNNQSAKLNALIGGDYPSRHMAVSGGLSLSASGFEHNSVFYSYGHGGYFSPQAMWQAGMFTHLESRREEVDWWELDVSVGYFQWRTKAQERYPYGLFKQRDLGGSGNGISYMLRGEKHWQLSEQLELGLSAELTRSPGYERWKAGLTFRYFWQKRNYLVSKHKVIRSWGE